MYLDRCGRGRGRASRAGCSVRREGHFLCSEKDNRIVDSGIVESDFRQLLARFGIPELDRIAFAGGQKLAVWRCRDEGVGGQRESTTRGANVVPKPEGTKSRHGVRRQLVVIYLSH